MTFFMYAFWDVFFSRDLPVVYCCEVSVSDVSKQLTAV